MSSKKDYIDYVRDVLGVQSLHGLNEMTIQGVEIPLVIYVEDYLTYSSPEKDLLDKMLLALKVPILQMLILDSHDPKNVNYEFRLRLTDEKPSVNPVLPNEIHTFSPRVLIKNAALKKLAWDDLQKVLLYFQSKTII